MSLSEAERNVMIQMLKDKSAVALKEADVLFANNLWNGAANRYYYALFNITQALFISRGLSCHTHSGMIGLFAQHFVKTGLIDRNLAGTLTRMEQMREKADYDGCYSVSEEDMTEKRTHIMMLYDAINKLII